MDYKKISIVLGVLLIFSVMLNAYVYGSFSEELDECSWDLYYAEGDLGIERVKYGVCINETPEKLAIIEEKQLTAIRNSPYYHVRISKGD